MTERKTNLIKHSFILAFRMLKDPWKTLGELGSETVSHALTFLLIIGALTALLTPLQVFLGFEDINGLHAGGQAEFLARDVPQPMGLGWSGDLY